MRFTTILFGLFCLGLGALVFALYDFNHFAKIERVFDGRCLPVRGITGIEDLQPLTNQRQVFISSHDRRAPEMRGAIHLFDLDDPLSAAGWRDRTNGAPDQFRPLGIDFYEEGDVRRLFVVNEANHAVEIFDIAADGALIHLETLSDPRLTSPNNLVAIGPRSFYVTNDVRPGRGSWIAPLHFLFRAPSGDVMFSDGRFWRVAAENLRFANGIEISPDGERLFVTETSGRALKVYARNKDNNALALTQTIPLQDAPDNVTLGDDGDLWIAALPKPLSFARQQLNAGGRAPSAVIRVNFQSDPQRLYVDNGEELTAASAAVRIGRDLMISAGFDEKFLICELPREPL